MQPPCAEVDDEYCDDDDEKRLHYEVLLLNAQQEIATLQNKLHGENKLRRALEEQVLQLQEDVNGLRNGDKSDISYTSVYQSLTRSDGYIVTHATQQDVIDTAIPLFGMRGINIIELKNKIIEQERLVWVHCPTVSECFKVTLTHEVVSEILRLRGCHTTKDKQLFVRKLNAGCAYLESLRVRAQSMTQKPDREKDEEMAAYNKGPVKQHDHGWRKLLMAFFDSQDGRRIASPDDGSQSAGAS